MGQPTEEDPRHDLETTWVPEPVPHYVERTRGKKRVTIHRQTEMYLCGHRAALINLPPELRTQFNKVHLT